MRRFTALAAISIALGLVPVPALRAQDVADKKRAALERGCDWLKKQQDANGEWDYEDKPFHLDSVPGHMTQGVTALCAYALLKSGVGPNDPAIVKAFAAIQKRPLEHVYAVGCVLLALEARVNWEPLDAAAAEPGKGTGEKGGGKPGGHKLDARDQDLAKRCVEFLEKAQRRGSWRYFGEPDEDCSNPQYALLGLDAAERLGLKVNRAVWEKAADFFVTKQEKDGPEVPTFPVIGADSSYLELKKIEKELQDKIRKIESGYKGKKAGEADGSGRTKEDQERLAEEEAAKKVGKTTERGGKPLDKMFARGWNYGHEGEAWTKETTGSMTASGLACLFVCKAHLEGAESYEKGMKPQVVKALRDGAAWISKNFTVTENPPKHIHHYYYLYGLERAGILGLIPTFGTHDWYTEGAEHLLGAQQADGRWYTAWGTSGPVVDTCFALLFLSRGTTPLVKVPERIATGSGGK